MSRSTEDGDSGSLPDLPEDILVLILADLDAWDILNCRQVSRAWRQAFSRTEYLRRILKGYTRSREVRSLHDEPVDLDVKNAIICVGHRYHNLGCGRTRKIDRYTLRASEQYDHWYPVGQWDYHESQPGGRLYSEHAASHLSRLGNKPFLFQATLWSYDDGLVACTPILGKDQEHGKMTEKIISIIDLETCELSTVPFDITGRVIRNITFRRRALVVEWAEREPFHALNDSEKVHRHFGTCFDVQRTENGSCIVTFRNEWKLHFLGLPLNFRDRFFSVHNGQHYAVYFWQPNRSMYTGDEDMPIEALFVWDISVASTYLPSLDPGGRNRPPETERAHPVSVFSFRDLDFLGIRQHSDISLMSMHIDSETWSLTLRENVCVAGQGYFDPAERLWRSTTTMFSYRGAGAARCQEWQGDLPPYRGHCSMESVDVEEIEKWFVPIMDIHDDTADVRFSLVETCFTGLSSENKLVIRVKSRDRWSILEDKLTAEIGQMGRIAGDERWLVGQNVRNELVVLKF